LTRKKDGDRLEWEIGKEYGVKGWVGEMVPVVLDSCVWHLPGSGNANVLLKWEAEGGAVTTVEGNC